MPTVAKKPVRLPPRPRGEKRVKRLTPDELVELLRRARRARAQEEAKRLEDDFVRGFYGE